MHLIEEQGVWFMEEHRGGYPQQGYPKWFITRAYHDEGYWLHNFAMFKVGDKYPDLESAKAALIMISSVGA